MKSGTRDKIRNLITRNVEVGVNYVPNVVVVAPPPGVAGVQRMINHG